MCVHQSESSNLESLIYFLMLCYWHFFAVSKLTKYWYQISKLVLLLRKDVNNDPKNTAANNFLKIFLSTKNRKILCYWSLEGKERILYAFWDQSFLKSSFAWAQYGPMISSDSNTWSWKLLVVTHISHIHL